MPFNVVVIDDEYWIRQGLIKRIHQAGRDFHVVAEYESANDFLKNAGSMSFDVIFADIKMPGITGLELIMDLYSNGYEFEFVIVSGYQSFEYAKTALRYGAVDYLVKPIDFKEFDPLLDRLSDKLHANLKELPAENFFNPLFNAILKYTKERFREKVKLYEVANHFNVSPNHLCKLFQTNMNTTFIKLITHLRIEEARKMLMNTDKTIDEICADVGFDNYYYFNKVFKRYVGLTPHKYRVTSGAGGKHEN